MKKYLVFVYFNFILHIAISQVYQGNTVNAEIFADTPYRLPKTELLGQTYGLPIHVFAHDADETGANILLMSVDIYIKNAEDTNFTAPIVFDALSQSEFESMFIHQSLSKPVINQMAFNLSACEAHAQHSLIFLDVHDAISGHDYVRINGQFWYFTILIPDSFLQNYHDIIDIRVDFNIDWSPDDRTYLRVERTDENNPVLSNWYRGDVHHHTMFTQNDAEIGLPLEVSKYMSKLHGIDWITTTDHSCDFDNYGNSMADNWNRLQQECAQLNIQDTQMIWIPGIEMSVNNSEGKIVHALCYPNSEAVSSLPYFGDGGGDLSATEVSLSNLLHKIDSVGGFCYAAHPFASGDQLSFAVDGSVWNIGDSEFPSNSGQFSNGDIVNCNNLAFASDLWSADSLELLKDGLVGGQIWNLFNTLESSDENYNPWNANYSTEIEAFQILDPNDEMHHTKRLFQNFEVSRFVWKKGLMHKNINFNAQNWKYYITAGTDAHGSFNYSNTDLAYGIGSITDNALGRLSTYVYSKNGKGNMGEHILSSLRSGHVILSSGPLVDLKIESQNASEPTAIIGDELQIPIASLSHYNLVFDAATSNLFGYISELKLFLQTENQEYVLSLSATEGEQILSFYNILNQIFGTDMFPTDEYFLMRAEVHTFKTYNVTSQILGKETEVFSAYTNPIWIQVQQSTLIEQNIKNTNQWKLSNEGHRLVLSTENKAAKIQNIAMFDAIGKLHHQGKGSVNSYQISTLEINQGWYFIQLTDENGTSNFKVWIE